MVANLLKPASGAAMESQRPGTFANGITFQSLSLGHFSTSPPSNGGPIACNSSWVQGLPLESSA